MERQYIPMDRLLVVCVQVSGIVPILFEISDDRCIQNGNRTYVKWIVLFLLYLLVRLQQHLAHELGVLAAAVATGSRKKRADLLTAL